MEPPKHNDSFIDPFGALDAPFPAEAGNVQQQELVRLAALTRVQPAAATSSPFGDSDGEIGESVSGERDACSLLW